MEMFGISDEFADDMNRFDSALQNFLLLLVTHHGLRNKYS